jgi:uncharacterized membrane protein
MGHVPCEREERGTIDEQVWEPVLFFTGLVAVTGGLTAAHRFLRSRWRWRVALVVGLPLAVLLLCVPAQLRPAAEVDEGLEWSAHAIIYVVILILSVEAAGVAQLAFRLRWPLYLAVCIIATSLIWLLSASVFFVLGDT